MYFQSLLRIFATRTDSEPDPPVAFVPGVEVVPPCPEAPPLFDVPPALVAPPVMVVTVAVAPPVSVTPPVAPPSAPCYILSLASFILLRDPESRFHHVRCAMIGS